MDVLCLSETDGIQQDVVFMIGVVDVVNRGCTYFSHTRVFVKKRTCVLAQPPTALPQEEGDYGRGSAHLVPCRQHNAVHLALGCPRATLLLTAFMGRFSASLRLSSQSKGHARNVEERKTQEVI